MDGSSSSSNNDTPPDSLLYFSGSAYRLLPLLFVRGACLHLVKFGARDGIEGFFHAVAHDLAMRERLRQEALRWAAYFGTGVAGEGTGRAWLVEQIFTGRLGLYEVICSGPPRGEPKKPDEKQVRAALSAVADNTPVVAPIKSALQMVTGVDLGTDEPVSRWGAAVGLRWAWFLVANCYLKSRARKSRRSWARRV